MKQTLSTLKTNRFSRNQLLAFVLLFAMIGSYFLYRSFAAAPLIASMEGEQMVLPAGASTITDTTASGGKAAMLPSNGSATGSINFPSSVNSITFMAKGGQCQGAPSMSVGLDGVNLMSVAVSSTSWTAYTVTPSTISSGNHNLSIAFSNDYSKTKGSPRNQCSRTLYIDVSNFYGPTPVATPAPTVTLSASPTSVTAGQASTLTWASTNANSCTASGAWSGTEPINGSASTGALNQSSTYTLTCTGTSGSASTSATVSVSAAIPPPSLSTIPNSLGVFAQTAPSWSDSSKWRGDSASLLSQLMNANTGGSELAISGYGVAYVKASSSDPVVTVTNTNGWGTAPGTTSFHSPSAAKPAAGTDAHLVVEQPDGSAVEMWKAAKSGSNWTAGAVSVAKAGQYYYTIAGCRGSSLTLASGIVTPQEVKAGVISHVLSVSLPSSVVSKSFVFPSYSSDGTISGGIPEGARMVLDPTYDISGLSGLKKIVAQALKTYGMIVVDRTGSDIEVDAQAPESWTAFGQTDQWAAQGLSGYPDLGITGLLSRMKIAIGN